MKQLRFAYWWWFGHTKGYKSNCYPQRSLYGIDGVTQKTIVKIVE